jgi:hypothetical protein
VGFIFHRDFPPGCLFLFLFIIAGIFFPLCQRIVALLSLSVKWIIMIGGIDEVDWWSKAGCAGIGILYSLNRL